MSNNDFDNILNGEGDNIITSIGKEIDDDDEYIDDNDFEGIDDDAIQFIDYSSEAHRDYCKAFLANMPEEFRIAQPDEDFICKTYVKFSEAPLDVQRKVAYTYLANDAMMEEEMEISEEDIQSKIKEFKGKTESLFILTGKEHINDIYVWAFYAKTTPIKDKEEIDFSASPVMCLLDKYLSNSIHLDKFMAHPFCDERDAYRTLILCMRDNFKDFTVVVSLFVMDSWLLSLMEEMGCMMSGPVNSTMACIFFPQDKEDEIYDKLAEYTQNEDE